MKKVGLALGGGGVRGFAHLGAIKGLKEKGIEPEFISGTSAGSIVGAFIASGMSPDDVLKLLKEKDLMAYSSFHWPKDGLLSFDGLEEVLNQQFEKTPSIEDLEIPLSITVSNLNMGRVEYLQEGPLVKSVLASSSIPFAFSPIELNGYKYSDGGILDNLPIKPLVDQCDKIIAISISPLEETKELDNLIQIATRTFQMSINAQNNELKNQCALYIELDDMREFGIFELEKADTLFDIGYQTIKDMDLSDWN